MKIAASVFALIAGVAGSAAAEELAPMQARMIQLGEVAGVAYYSVASDGFQVVATVATGEGGAPVRFVATLASGQKMLISVPQAANRPAKELAFARLGNTILVSEPTEKTATAN